MINKKQEDFLKLYEPIHDRFERFCRARVYGEMDYCDLMNETLLVAFQKFESLRSNEAFLSFLFGICIRILSNNNKKKKVERIQNEQDINGIKDDSIDPENYTDIAFLYEMLAQLTEEQRESILLFELAGFSIKEIAEMHQVGESAVKQRLKRGREKLADLINYESVLKMGTRI